MVEELTGIEKEANIMLSGYHSYLFEKENLVIFFKGSIHSGSEKVNIEKWINVLARHLTDKDSSFNTFLLSELAKISGLFSLVIKNGNDYFITADIIRTMPVFYGFIDNDFFIASNLYEYQRQNNPLPIDNDQLEEYIASGFVYGNGTIYKNIYAIQAAELITIKGHEITSERYFAFKPAEKRASFENIKDFTKAFDKVMLSVFARMIDQTPKVNRWVVPLSGGHDSRMIVNYLYRLGIKNVVCFSYGMIDNEQSALSRQVAEALGFEWHFVEYTEEKWQKLHESGIIDEFIWYSFNGVSIPHLQDFLAVYELKEKKIIRQNDVFTPGHAFDFLVGSNLEQSDIACENKTEAVERTFRMHSTVTDSTHSPVRTIEDIYEKAKVVPSHFQEYFNWQEKRAKFLVNTARGYEYFGFEFRLPYWDREIVDFWLTIPDNERMGRKIFFEAEQQGILVDQIISIPFYGKVDRDPPSIVENALRRILPGFLKTFILRITHHKVEYKAGLNQIYAIKASTVRELLEPIEDFPVSIRPYFNDFLNRFPYQADYHFITSLFAIRKQLDLNKNL
jgi:asparagine synthase (glutamine-hydrolysing)